MGHNRWLPLVISLIGVLNVFIIGQFYLVNRLVVYPLSSDAPSSPLAKGLARLSSKIESGQTRIAPETDTGAVKHAVEVASIGLKQRAAEAVTQLNISREMLRNTLLVSALQFVFAGIAFVRRRKAV